MAKKRIYQNRTLSNLELQERYQDSHSEIKSKLDERIEKINWKRRNQGEKSLLDFIKVYAVPLMLDTFPTKHFQDVVNQMDVALNQKTPYQICLPRSAGKTILAEIACLRSLAYGFRKFAVIISQNQSSAASILSDIWRILREEGTDFSNDFPELVAPFEFCNGSTRRKQTYNGVSTAIAKTSKQVIFARLVDDNGKEKPTSQSCIEVRGISSGVRGLRHNSIRPDLILLDDLQDYETAQSQEQVQKLLEIINKDILNLGKSGNSMNIIMTSTPLTPDDLVSKISSHKGWMTSRYPALLKEPSELAKDDNLWKKYFELYDDETIEKKPHQESLKFYKENHKQMSDGAELFQPERFSEQDGQIDALQALMQKRHLIGEDAFLCELQLKPRQNSFLINITPEEILGKTSDFKHWCGFDDAVLTTCAIDINSSYALTWSIHSWKRDSTNICIGYGFEKIHIDQKLPDVSYGQELYKELKKLYDKLQTLPIKIDCIAIDGARGRDFDTVCSFSKSHPKCCCFCGRGSTNFNPLSKNRLRNAVGDTVLCGNAEELVKSGSGFKYVLFNADSGKLKVIRALKQVPMSIGSCFFWNGSKDDLREASIQLCNEKLVYINHKQDGRDIYTWKTFEPHDLLDVFVMNFSIAQQQNLMSFSNNFTSNQSPRNIRNLNILKKKKYKFV